MLRDGTDRAWFSRLLRHPARKRSGSILTTPEAEPARAGTTFNDLDWFLTVISWSRDFSTLNISETTQDRAIVTIEHQQEVIGSLSNGDIFNDLR